MPRCLVKVAPGRAYSGPLTAWNREEDLLFRYMACPGDALSARIEDVMVLRGAAPLRSAVDGQSRVSTFTVRRALGLPLVGAAAVDAGVLDQLVAWGLSAASDVPVARLPHMLVELVARGIWHTLLWRSSSPGGLLLRDVLDFPSRDWVRRPARSGPPAHRPDGPIAPEFWQHTLGGLQRWAPALLAGQGERRPGDEEATELELQLAAVGVDSLRRAVAPAAPRPRGKYTASSLVEQLLLGLPPQRCHGKP